MTLKTQRAISWVQVWVGALSVGLASHFDRTIMAAMMSFGMTTLFYGARKIGEFREADKRYGKALEQMNKAGGFRG